MIELPETMRRTAESWGPVGRTWLAALPSRVDHLVEAWSLTIDEVLDGGTAAYVARVRTNDGTYAVLKVALPGIGFAQQVRTIMAADGRGYVRLHTYDPAHDAVLLESLGPTLATAATSVEQALDVLSAMLTEAWRVPKPAGAIVAPGTNKATQLIGLITELWSELEEPCPRHVVDEAVSYARRRVAAFDMDTCVVCHGDPHPGNALEVPSPRPGADAGFVFVDPDGLLAEPAYDLGVLVRGWTDQVLAAENPATLVRGYCTRLAAATGIAEQAIWEWGFTERVSSGLYLIRHGHDAEGREYLASAERLVA